MVEDGVGKSTSISISELESQVILSALRYYMNGDVSPERYNQITTVKEKFSKLFFNFESLKKEHVYEINVSFRTTSNYSKEQSKEFLISLLEEELEKLGIFNNIIMKGIPKINNYQLDETEFSLKLKIIGD
jgi:hypothetical protein